MENKGSNAFEKIKRNLISKNKNHGKIKKFIQSEKVSNRIRCEVLSHKESGYLIVVVDKNDDGDYVLKYTCFRKLDRRKVKWAGEIVDANADIPVRSS